MRTRDFSFGVAVYDYVLPEELRAMLERWVDEVSADHAIGLKTSRASGVKAWAVRHEAGVQHHDVLAESVLGRIISELASL